MSDLIQAASTIREIAVKLRGFELAAAALERVGSFEQAEAEAKASAEKAKTEAAVALADLDAARKEADDMRAEGAKAKATAVSEADEVLRGGVETADHLVAEAQAQAERIVDGGKSKAAEHMRVVLSQVESEEEKLAELRAKTIELERANLEAVTALETTEAKLRTAREQIANLLGS